MMTTNYDVSSKYYQYMGLLNYSLNDHMIISHLSEIILSSTKHRL
jgi:hypothetical protein